VPLWQRRLGVGLQGELHCGGVVVASRRLGHGGLGRGRVAERMGLHWLGEEEGKGGGQLGFL
jgi:hypothetical protein